MKHFAVTQNIQIICTHPEYNARMPSSRPILNKAWNMPRYRTSIQCACPWTWSRVFVRSMGNVPERFNYQIINGDLIIKSINTSLCILVLYLLSASVVNVYCLSCLSSNVPPQTLSVVLYTVWWRILSCINNQGSFHSHSNVTKT